MQSATLFLMGKECAVKLGVIIHKEFGLYFCFKETIKFFPLGPLGAFTLPGAAK